MIAWIRDKVLFGVPVGILELFDEGTCMAWAPCSLRSDETAETTGPYGRAVLNWMQSQAKGDPLGLVGQPVSGPVSLVGGKLLGWA